MSLLIGADATWDDYLEISAAPDKKFRVEFFYKLPNDWDAANEITRIKVVANSMGVEYDYQRRQFSIRNQATKKWNALGDNEEADSWEWTEQSFIINAAEVSDYLKDKEIRLRFQSNNDDDVCDLDFLQVQIDYTNDNVFNPIPSAPPTIAQTVAPTSEPSSGPTLSPTGGPTSDVTTPVGPFEVKTAEDLPPANPDVAANNPLRGMMTSPLWVDYASQITDIPTSLDYYYIGLDTTMFGFNTFDWSHLESLLNDSASQNRHAIVRFILDYPDDRSYVPSFLTEEEGLGLTPYDAFGGGDSPNYSSPVLLTALQQFITAFGANYDGDSRLAFIQIGLLGFWGEWHTYPHPTWIPDSTKNSVSEWFSNAFTTTPLQLRYPHSSAIQHKFGFHDDSFAHSTLSDTTSWFFWPSLVALSPDYSNEFWKRAVMGGELRPELQETAFSANFPNPDNEFEQDFDSCVDTTHATYMLNNWAFSTGYNGDDIARAKASANRLGYQFRVAEVVASTNAAGTVDLDVKVLQVGVAPFYYSLGIKVECGSGSGGIDWALTLPSGVEDIIEQGDTQTFKFSGLPKTSSCLNDVVISLDCAHCYPSNPVKFAQGSNNDYGSVKLSFAVPA